MTRGGLDILTEEMVTESNRVVTEFLRIPTAAQRPVFTSERILPVGYWSTRRRRHNFSLSPSLSFRFFSS